MHVLREWGEQDNMTLLARLDADLFRSYGQLFRIGDALERKGLVSGSHNVPAPGSGCPRKYYWKLR